MRQIPRKEDRYAKGTIANYRYCYTDRNGLSNRLSYSAELVLEMAGVALMYDQTF